MTGHYAIADTSTIFSPGLLFFKDLIRYNIAQTLTLAGSAERLRPHVKTHKTAQIVDLQLAAGISKHKCATIAEAEMLAQRNVPDVLIGYPLVGPNIGRLAQLMKLHPSVRFSTTVDHADSIDALSAGMTSQGLTLNVLLDLNVGQHRTGVPVDNHAIALYERLGRSNGLRPDGLHVYDGHTKQDSRAERDAIVHAGFEGVLEMRRALEKKGLPAPRIVAGGTPTFPVYAAMNVPGLECSPGTCTLYDQGYGEHYADLAQFKPAALLLTRVVSRPTPTRVTFDLGTKSIASDPPAGKRVRLLDVPEHQFVIHNEEHLVIETAHAERFRPGHEMLAIPGHVCPTVAWHRFAYVIEGGKLTETWQITARDRMLTV
jgi:D-threonine aldolase